MSKFEITKNKLPKVTNLQKDLDNKLFKDQTKIDEFFKSKNIIGQNLTIVESDWQYVAYGNLFTSDFTTSIYNDYLADKIDFEYQTEVKIPRQFLPYATVDLIIEPMPGDQVVSFMECQSQSLEADWITMIGGGETLYDGPEAFINTSLSIPNYYPYIFHDNWLEKFPPHYGTTYNSTFGALDVLEDSFPSGTNPGLITIKYTAPVYGIKGKIGGEAILGILFKLQETSGSHTYYGQMFAEDALFFSGNKPITPGTYSYGSLDITSASSSSITAKVMDINTTPNPDTYTFGVSHTFSMSSSSVTLSWLHSGTPFLSSVAVSSITDLEVTRLGVYGYYDSEKRWALVKYDDLSTARPNVAVVFYQTPPPTLPNYNVPLPFTSFSYEKNLDPHPQIIDSYTGFQDPRFEVVSTPYNFPLKTFARSFQAESFVFSDFKDKDQSTTDNFTLLINDTIIIKSRANTLVEYEYLTGTITPSTETINYPSFSGVKIKQFAENFDSFDTSSQSLYSTGATTNNIQLAKQARIKVRISLRNPNFCKENKIYYKD